MINILLVEDSLGDQKLFEEALKEEKIDCQLVIASSAKDSINAISTQKFDLIVMDIKMPGISGADFVPLLQGSALTKFIPIIFVTGMKEAALNFSNGMSIEDKTYPILSKPVDPQQLKEAITLVLRK